MGSSEDWPSSVEPHWILVRDISILRESLRFARLVCLVSCVGTPRKRVGYPKKEKRRDDFQENSGIYRINIGNRSCCKQLGVRFVLVLYAFKYGGIGNRNNMALRLYVRYGLSVLVQVYETRVMKPERW